MKTYASKVTWETANKMVNDYLNGYGNIVTARGEVGDFYKIMADVVECDICGFDKWYGADCPNCNYNEITLNTFVK